MSIVSQKQCPDCVNGLMAYDAKPSMTVPKSPACSTCHGMGILPVTIENLEYEALQLAGQLPGKKWIRGSSVPDSAVRDMELVTRLQAIEEEYYREGGKNFPV